MITPSGRTGSFPKQSALVRVEDSTSICGFRGQRPHWLQNVIAWVGTMQLPGSLCHFRLHANAEPSVFASCFALFLLHLCRETESWDEKTRAAWVDYVCGFQEKESGLFRDSDTLSRVTDSDHNAEHMDRQLTGFCISALRALQAQPRYRLSYVVPWCDENYMRRWLTTRLVSFL